MNYMTIHDCDRLQVSLSPRDGAYALSAWPVLGDQGVVGTAKRTKGLGSIFSGLRHRLPVELIDGDGTVLCAVRRSIALKGDVGRYTVRDSSGNELGFYRHRREKDASGAARGWVDILGSDENRIAARTFDGQGSGYRFESAYPGWHELRGTLTPNRSEWTTAETRSISGLGRLSEHHRLLAAALTVIHDPWRSGEKVASRRSASASSFN
ncbi:MAG: hypothetical protein ACR2OD_07295 [Gaiellaceae bacterium]